MNECLSDQIHSLAGEFLISVPKIQQAIQSSFNRTAEEIRVTAR